MHHLTVNSFFVHVWWEALRATLSQFQVHSTVLLTRVTMLYSRSFRTYPVTGSLYPLTYISFPPPPQTLRSHHSNLFPWNWFLSFFFGGVGGFTCKWYHTSFVFLCLVYFTQQNALQVHPYYCTVGFPSFLWLNKILLCVYIYTNYIFFIHSSVHVLFPYLSHH